MAQKLIQPINNTKLTASWKTDAYQQRFKSVHYGVDCVSTKGNTTVYASGVGTVLAAGTDSVLGNFVAVKYPDAENWKTGEKADLVIRYFHFQAVRVKKGQAVTKDTVLGLYGATGRYVAGAHLHFEVDTDTKYVMYTPTLTGNSSHFYGTRSGANGKTMTNPLEWIHRKVTAPDNQTYTTTNDEYILAADKKIQTIL